MKYFMILLSVSSFILASDYQQSAREKDRQYAVFIKVMKMLETENESESPAIKERNFLVSNIYVKPEAVFIRVSEEDNDENEWHLLKREDFDTTIKVSTPE